MKTIGLDIDGVILDFERVMNTYAELYDYFILHKAGVINKDEFSYLKKYNWTKEEKDYFVNNYLVYCTKRTPLLPGALEVLTLLKDLDYKIEIITARGSLNPLTKEVVRGVLDDYQIPYDNIHFGITDKTVLAKNLQLDYMIEDNPDICLSIANEGINTIYMRDKNSRIIDHEYVQEVNNWGEIARLLIKSKVDSHILKKVLPF